MSASERALTLPSATSSEPGALKAEFTQLQKLQWAALEEATFVGMTAYQAQEYERRARRINELQRALGINLSPPST